MIKLTKERAFTSKVTAQEPKGNNTFTPASFMLNFVVIEREEATALLEEDDQQFFDRVIKGWDHVADDDGEPLFFTAENLRRLVQVPYYYSAIVETYFREAFGGKAKRKN